MNGYDPLQNIPPKVKEKVRRVILNCCGYTDFCRHVSEYILDNNWQRGHSIPKNVWAVYQDTVIFLDDKGMYEDLMYFGYSKEFVDSM